MRAYVVTHFETVNGLAILKTERFFFSANRAIAYIESIYKPSAPIEFASDGLNPLWSLGRGNNQLKIDAIEFEDDPTDV